MRIIDALTLRRLNPRDRRAILLGAAVLLPALLWIAAVRPYRDALTDVQAHVDTERALLEREEALLARAETLPASVDEQRQRAERAQHRLVVAENSTLAEAELTRYLEEIALLSRVLLEDIRSVAPRRGETIATGSLRPLRLSVHGESDFEGVLSFLHRIETGPLLMRVTEFSIDPVWAGSDRTGDRAPTGVTAFNLVLDAFAPAGPDTDAAEEVR